MWGRGRNRANPGMVPTWGRSSSNRGMGSSSSLYRTHNRTALGSSRGGDGGRRGHNSYCGSGGEGRHSSGDSGRARVGPPGRGRRGAAHLRSEAVSFVRLHHDWAREGEERMGGGELQR